MADINITDMINDRENSYETRILSGKLMQQVRALETEIRLSEVQK